MTRSLGRLLSRARGYIRLPGLNLRPEVAVETYERGARIVPRKMGDEHEMGGTVAKRRPLLTGRMSG